MTKKTVKEVVCEVVILRSELNNLEQKYDFPRHIFFVAPTGGADHTPLMENPPWIG